jgi:alpha-tubulin suppressor-like RCC1 family protein
MHRRTGRALVALLAIVPAALVTGCSEPETDPTRIVSLSLVSGGSQTGFVGALLPDPLVVRAIDQDGQPVSGIVITWSVVTGGGVVTPADGTSDADGLTSTSFRLGSTLGTQSVRALIAGSNSTPITFNATATAAPASMIAIASGDNQTGVVQTQLPADLTVKVTDAFGNAKEGITVFYNILLGNGTLSAATAQSDAAGLARVKWTLGPLASTQRVSAQIPGAVPVIFDATGTPAAPAIVTVVSGNNQSAPPGALLQDSLVIRVTDQYENPVRDVTVAWTVTAANGSVSPIGGKTDAVGRLATAWTLGPTGGPKEARAVVQGLPPATFMAGATIVFANVMAGGRHTCALDEGGVAYCWGFNDAGQLGIGSVTPGSGPVFANLFPNPVVGGLTFARGASGASHGCAVTIASSPYCWGLAASGQLGNGQSGADLKVPSPAAVDLPETQAVTAGGAHTCALKVSGKLFCWGSNDQGRLGVGSAAPLFSLPQAVAPGLNFASVAAGALHTCAVSTTGLLYCWGSNTSGQAGLGAAAGANVPTQVTGSAYAQVVAGERHTCGRRSGGDVRCWGNNDFGQLGDGTTMSRTTPVAAAQGIAFTSITAGQNHTCGIANAGVVYCWGFNETGQLGNNGNTSSAIPQAVGGGLNFVAISAGGLQTCGITLGRVAYCWGNNQYGALGDGTTDHSLVPVKVAFQP